MTTKVKSRNGDVGAIGPVSNDAKFDVEMSRPFAVAVTIEGTAAFLCHRWSTEAVAEKAAAGKNTKAKKTDNVESYVYRTPNNEIGIPGEYLRQAIIEAGRWIQDPRSPRKSARDLFKAGVVSLTDVASLGKTEWDYLDARRVQVQRAGITRVRPAFLPGWRVEFEFQILIPEYLTPMMILNVITQAGRLVGLGDFRPTFGRFNVIKFEVME